MNRTSDLTIESPTGHGTGARAWRLVVVALAVSLLLGLPVAAQESPAAEESPCDALSRLVGRWELTSEVFVDAAGHPEIALGRPTVSESMVERDMILGGTVLREEVWGRERNAEGEPVYQGLGLTGCEEASGKYWRTWVDTESPGVYVMDGSREGDVITFRGEFSDPATGETRAVRSVLRLAATRQQLEWFEEYGGTEMQTLQHLYDEEPEEMQVPCPGPTSCCDDPGDCCSGLACSGPNSSECPAGDWKGTCAPPSP